jgi:hypothetical protein
MTSASRRSDRTLRWLGVLTWGATVSLTVAALWLRATSGMPPIENRFGMNDASMLGFCVLQVTCATVGLVVVRRLPRNLVAWILIGIGFGYAVSILSAAYVFGTATSAGTVRAPMIAWLTQAGAQVAGVLTFAFIYVYPELRGTTRAGRIQVGTAFVFTTLGIGIIAIHPGPLFFWPTVENPLGIGPRIVLDTVGDAALIPIPLGMFGLLAAGWIAWRFHRSRGIERLQLKWFVSAAVVSTLTLIGLVILGANSQGARSDWWPLLLYALSTTLVPIAVGIAILRYRLYAIDHLIDRAIGYGVVTTILVAIFGLLVVALTTLLEPITGGETIPVAASTLVVAALFQPVRRWVQRAIDRRFHRARYDAAATVDSFAERLRRTVDLGALEGELLTVVDRSVSPSRATIWVARGAHPDRPLMAPPTR